MSIGKPIEYEEIEWLIKEAKKDLRKIRKRKK